ncbi:MAG: UDP-N-acetylmuramate--L-alanine ligase [Bdellovibrio sp. CG10_big_fil_rev_8_21_14_0_10_47_8]|nr:MAG: UDP-N-acetylmuramate--L-alanine ligase [Bdellovibrio sp. CG10_big_fil_rev_8_21_14_0_10_47_8]
MQLQKSKFHFVGIGGIGMCGLAELLHNMGAQVSGSDLGENDNTEHLKKVGVQVYRGHRAENVGNADVVVFSSAVQDSNPEIQQARAQKIPLIPRAEALAEIMRLKRGVAIAGTHGKTTTTSMTAAIFLQAKARPTIVIGGRFDLIQSTALLGDGEWIVAEADESDGSFSKLSPEISVITNIDSDHLDYYKSFENLQKAFFKFAQKIPFYGICIVCGDDPQVREVFSSFPKRILFYGFDDKNDLVVKGQKGKYELFENTQTGRKKLGEFDLKVPGAHNALNAVAAIGAGLQAGFTFEACKQGLAQFEGVDRRFHFKGERNKIRIYDDYAHHPTEVRAALQGFREKFPDRRLVVLFQPHRFSRTQSCWHDFTACFSQCDQLFLTDVYPAGEAPIEGIDSQRLAKEIKHEHCIYLPKGPEIAQQIFSELKSGDVFVTLGAGDGWKIGTQVLEMLK